MSVTMPGLRTLIASAVLVAVIALGVSLAPPVLEPYLKRVRFRLAQYDSTQADLRRREAWLDTLAQAIKAPVSADGFTMVAFDRFPTGSSDTISLLSAWQSRTLDSISLTEGYHFVSRTIQSLRVVRPADGLAFQLPPDAPSAGYVLVGPTGLPQIVDGPLPNAVLQRWLAHFRQLSLLGSPAAS